MKFPIGIVDALNSLVPGAIWGCSGNEYAGLQWYENPPEEGGIRKPTEEEIQAEIIRLQSEYDLKEYQRLRAPEYPPKEDFIDAYYWSQRGDNTKMNEYLEKCDDVKIKYPKP